MLLINRWFSFDRCCHLIDFTEILWSADLILFMMTFWTFFCYQMRGHLYGNDAIGRSCDGHALRRLGSRCLFCECVCCAFKSAPLCLFARVCAHTRMRAWIRVHECVFAYMHAFHHSWPWFLILWWHCVIVCCLCAFSKAFAAPTLASRHVCAMPSCEYM